MADQQMTAFEAFLKRELPDHSIEEIAPGTLNLARNAWQAALSHAEGEAPFAYCFTDVNGRPTEFTDGPEHSAPEDKRVITALYRHPAPQVAVPEGWRPIESAPLDGSHIQLYRPEIQFIGYYGGANSGWRHNAPGLEAIWPEPTHWRPIAAAPTARAGEPAAYVEHIGGYTSAAIRNNSGLDLKVGQALFTRPEQPVSDPDGLPEPPRGAAHNARVFVDQIENGPYETISTHYEWQQLRRCLVAMAEYVEHAPEIAERLRAGKEGE